MCWCICHHANCWIFGCEQSVKMGMLRKRVMCALLMAPKVYHGKRVGGVRLMAAFFIFHKMWKCGGMCVLFSIKCFLSLSYTCAMDLFVLVLACVCVCMSQCYWHAQHKQWKPFDSIPHEHTHLHVFVLGSPVLCPDKIIDWISFFSIEREHCTALNDECMNFSPLLFLLAYFALWYMYIVHVFQCYMRWLYWSINWRKKLIRNTEQWINLQWV